MLEASTGIEPVYTDLQSAASPLRQLAAQWSAVITVWLVARQGVEGRPRFGGWRHIAPVAGGSLLCNQSPHICTGILGVSHHLSQTNARPKAVD